MSDSVEADEEAARLAAAVPAGCVADELVAILPALSNEGSLDAARGFERLIAWLQGKQAAALAQAARRAPAIWRNSEHNWTQEQVENVLAVSANGAGARMQVAHYLEEHPLTTQLLERGEITLSHVRVFIDELANCSAEVAGAVEAAVLPTAPGRTPAAVRRSVRRAVLRHTPPQTQADQLDRRGADTWVASFETNDGMAELRARGPVEGVHAVMATLTGMARAARATEPRGTRTGDQRRFDALVQLATTADPNSPVAREQRLRPAVQVVVALSTLLALDEQPAELDGQPIPAQLARRIAADPSGSWRRLVTDELGVLRDYGRSTYRPPADLADHVLARDRTCTWPGCHRPAQRCDIDHRRGWADGGQTAEPNLQALCRRHHRAKDHAGWRTRLLADGSTEWTSPAGRTTIRPPATYPVDTTGRDLRKRRRQTARSDRSGSEIQAQDVTEGPGTVRRREPEAPRHVAAPGHPVAPGEPAAARAPDMPGHPVAPGEPAKSRAPDMPGHQAAPGELAASHRPERPPDLAT
ncbi:MAG: hypothetical protein QOE97_447 [Pseudonocardiales bacterium]|nr:hypothetical protein [Pseudonocardiales bacterium]